jgi:Spermine/spermidine synthase domain
MQLAERSSAAPTFRLGERPRLILASFLMLFAELALIRWAAAYVVYVAYFTNFVLLASFLGIGVGFLRAGKDRDLSRWAPAAFALAAGTIFVFRVVKGTQGSTDLDTIFGFPAPLIWIALPILFGVTVFAMATIAEGVARLFARFEPLEAYRLDITGSLLGIVAFSVLSFLRTGPVTWGIVIAGLFMILSPRAAEIGRWIAVAAIVAVFAAGWLAPNDTWSPYYRVTRYPTEASGRTALRVNSLPHQSMLPLPSIEAAFYSKPYTHLGGRSPGNVLIVGAGSGNDLSLALANDADHVDAVEIDPVLQATGRDLHPEHPYQDPRVTVHIDDGRAFLERSDDEFDLILFALPDSLTLVSGQGSLRLESYLFTRESMEEVRDHLAPAGAFAMYNYYKPFVFERYANTMAQVFGHEPCFDAIDQQANIREQAVLTIGREPTDIECSTPWQPASVVPSPATDDHPFPYIQGRTIPAIYAWWLSAILLASIAIVRITSGEPLGSLGGYVDLFFMGAAFLLLETKSVVQFALLFGTTWLVNSLVFAGILLAVLLAIEVTRRVRLPRPAVLYFVLVAALVIAWFVPPDTLLGLAPIPRFLAGVAVAFAPVFLANLIFAQRFKDVGASTRAFAANLLGAMVGGVLEYLAIVTGYRALLIVVAALYGLAFLTGRRHLRSAQAPPPPAADAVPVRASS